MTKVIPFSARPFSPRDVRSPPQIRPRVPDPHPLAARKSFTAVSHLAGTATLKCEFPEVIICQATAASRESFFFLRPSLKTLSIFFPWHPPPSLQAFFPKAHQAGPFPVSPFMSTGPLSPRPDSSIFCEPSDQVSADWWVLPLLRFLFHLRMAYGPRFSFQSNPLLPAVPAGPFFPPFRGGCRRILLTSLVLL